MISFTVYSNEVATTPPRMKTRMAQEKETNRAIQQQEQQSHPSPAGVDAEKQQSHPSPAGVDV
jgi:hypothetical protein